MDSSISVVTSICGGKDWLVEDQNKGQAKWIAYLDKTQYSKDWEIKKAYDLFYSPRRNSRVPKILIHQFVTTEYSIWLDGNLKLLIPPEEVVKRYLQDHDLAVYRHPNRDCLYEEAITCAKRGLDDPEVIIEQVKGYEDQGFAKHKGLAENMMLIRRHTPKVEAFNNAWWSEYTRHSVRDQLSFPWAVDKVGLRVNYLTEQFREENGRWLRGDVLEIIPHQHFQ